jgi:serine/threonine protein kinase
VVRLLDAGRGWVPVEGSPIALPWLALEFVNGGAAGTTLHDRVAHSIRSAGCAFDVRRTKRALHCLVEGLDAVHGAGVVHRDIKPNNILCSGSGSDEIFKLADFGIARPHDMAATFGGILVGTPGYASPEQAALDARRVGPWSDVFSLACVVYFMLTGEDYFRADAAPDVLLAVHDKNRRSVAESDSLCTELRKDGVRSTRVDRALANATAAHPRDRPQSAADLGSLLEPLLQ